MQVPTEINKLPENSTHLHQQSNTSKSELKISQSTNRHRRTKTIQQEAAHKNTTLKAISKQSYNITQVIVERDSVAVYPRSLWAYRKKRTSPDCLKIKKNCIEPLDYSVCNHIIILQ